MLGVSSRILAPPNPDWRLRTALLLALGVLLVMAVAVTPKRSSAKALTAGSPGNTHAPGTATGQSGLAATNPPVTVKGAVTRPQAGGGCGLSLTGQASDPRGPRTLLSAPVGQCTVLEIGDSLGNDLGWGLGRHVAPTGGLSLVQLDRSDTGLSNSSFFDWRAQLSADVNQYHPQLVIISLGGNDEQGMEVNGSAVKFSTPDWQAAYLARVRQLVSEATASGAYVLWVGMPIMQQPSYSQGMQTLNTLYQQGVSAEANATFVSTWSLFSDPQGQFQSGATVNGTKTTLRNADGIHYSYAGEDVLATFVIRQIATIYHVQLAPTDPAVITGWS